MTSTSRRTGFLISALLHLAVAAAFITQIDHSNGQDNVDRTVPLTLGMFREAEPAPPAQEPAPAAPVSNEQKTPVTKRERLQPAIQPRPTPVPRTEPAIKPLAQPEPGIARNEGTIAKPEAAAEPIAKESDARSPGSSAQQESVKQHYLKMLLKRIHKKKHYPRRSRRNREEGEVLVSFVIEQSGDISSIRVSRSSGYDRLDKAALKTITRLNPTKPIPAELGISRWELAVPIAFDLR